MSRRVDVLAAVAAVAALALAAPTARAQEPAAAPEPAAEEPAEPTPIPVAQIPTQASVVAAQLDGVRQELESVEVEKRVEEELHQRGEELAARQVELEKALEGRQASGQLESVEATWRAFAKSLAADQRDLSERAQRLETLAEEPKRVRQRWELTRDAARVAGAPPSVRDQVKATLASLASTDRELQAKRNQALELEGQVGKLASDARTAIDRIAKARAELRARTFQRTAPPLWGVGERTEGLTAEITGATDILASSARDAADYARGHPGRMLVHLFLVIAILWAIRRARIILEGEERTAPAALRYPLAAALVFGASFQVVVHPEAPIGFRYLVGVLVLPFWVRVLLGLLPPVFAGPAYGFVVLVVLSTVSLLIGDTPFLPRVLELGLFGAGLAGTLWLRRPARLAELPLELRESRWSHLLGFWLRLAIAGFAAGLLASILGYGNLTGLLSTLVVVGTLIGSVFLLAVRIAEALIEALVARGSFDRMRMIRSHPERFLRVTRIGLRTLGLFAWIQRTLITAGLWDPVSTSARGVLSAQIGYGAVNISLGGIIAFVLALWLSWLLSRFVAYALDEEVFTRVRLAPGVPFALASFTRYGILVLGFIMAVGVLGFPLDRLTLVVSALGVGIGFGLQNIVNNFVSGAILLFERPIRVGDLIQLDSLFGYVSTIGIRASRVRTFDGSDVLVPNGDLISARVTNWTLSDRKRRIDFPVGVAYGTDPTRVLELLVGVAAEHPDVLEQPEPEALFRGFGDSSLDFALRCWTESERGLFAVQSDLLTGINAALAEAGIEIPFPQRDLHLRSVDPAARRDPPED